MQVLKFTGMIATNEQSELRNSSGSFTILTVIRLILPDIPAAWTQPAAGP
jgi:hypothetical protein